MPGFPKRKGHCRVAVNAQKPFAPVSPAAPRPRPAGNLNSPTVLFVFSLHRRRRTAPSPPQNQQPTLRLESRRRIGGKIIKILHCGQKAVLSQTTAEKEQRRTYLRDETPFTLTAGKEKQQRGPSSRKQSLTEPKHEKKGRRSWNPVLVPFILRSDLGALVRVGIPTHCPLPTFYALTPPPPHAYKTACSRAR